MYSLNGLYTYPANRFVLKLMKAITRECRTKGGKSLIELQIFNGASPIKLHRVQMSFPKKESGNAMTPHYLYGGKYS